MALSIAPVVPFVEALYLEQLCPSLFTLCCSFALFLLGDVSMEVQDFINAPCQTKTWIVWGQHTGMRGEVEFS